MGDTASTEDGTASNQDAAAALPIQEVFTWTAAEDEQSEFVTFGLCDGQLLIGICPSASNNKNRLDPWVEIAVPLEAASELAQKLMALPPVKALTRGSPLVMHFDNDDERDRFVAGIRQNNPQMQITAVSEETQTDQAPEATPAVAFPGGEQANLGTFLVTAPLLDACLGIPPGFNITGADTVQPGVIQLAVVGEGVPPSSDGNPVPLRYSITEERGHGILGGTIRRTAFERDEAQA